MTRRMSTRGLDHRTQQNATEILRRFNHASVVPDCLSTSESACRAVRTARRLAHAFGQSPIRTSPHTAASPRVGFRMLLTDRGLRT